MAASIAVAFRTGFVLAALGGVVLGAVSLLLNGVSVAGVLVPLILGRSARDRLYGCMGLAPAAVAGLGGYLLLDTVLDVAFTRAG
ncbi:hypothetical protein [Dactylosporangium matsuzakiense]|uniref:Uncharacterized protein n=1 Tax=Dactylosporangium matsuzakiense TaxID=53360 RepID=A0A9W6KW17_9ACTN|nr:hypothetical protein [Dactylosporangium matsuzakiense]UWZ48335.1 hypothetical protein Dmats_19155 [Dactylosporangium matsuzakiense]GLL07626.1 hypothetical protein GCM10017581_093800 [Dactylosporangium matsuzakiense]